jgi:colicin import membrane protein
VTIVVFNTYSFKVPTFLCLKRWSIHPTMEQDLYLEELAAKIKQQRAKIQALELEAEEHRQSEERYRNERLAEEHRLRETEQKHLFYLREEQRHKDRQARDESAIQAHLCHKAAVEEQKAKDRQAQNEATRQAYLYRKAAEQEQKTRDRQAQEEADRRYKAAEQAQKIQDRLLQEDTERQRLQRAIDIDQRQAARNLVEDQYRLDRVE